MVYVTMNSILLLRIEKAKSSDKKNPKKNK